MSGGHVQGMAGAIGNQLVAHAGLSALLVLLLGAAACRTTPRVSEPPPPLSPAATAPAAAQGDAMHSAADVHFLQMMLAHHAQALEMAALVPDRTDRSDIRMAAERIAAAQRDEMHMMERWLAARGFPAAAPHARHHEAHEEPSSMGMLSRAERDRLAAARGARFDQLFLEYMIRHHEGAMVMVRELFATAGAGQEPEIYQIASHVDADQRAEIDRMRRMQQGTLQ